MATQQNGNLHKDEAGTVITGTFKNPDGTVFDISAATVKKISFENPASPPVVTEVDADFVDDGTDGQVSYTLNGELNVAGIWKIQGRVAFAGGNILRSDVVEVRVFANNAAPA